MDTLNDYYPVYPRNPDAPSVSDSDYSEDFENIKRKDLFLYNQDKGEYSLKKIDAKIAVSIAKQIY
jgi:hypothetical protein